MSVYSVKICYFIFFENTGLVELAFRLLHDHKKALERLNQNSNNSSRPPSLEKPWFNRNENQDKKHEDKELEDMYQMILSSDEEEPEDLKNNDEELEV